MKYTCTACTKGTTDEGEVCEWCIGSGVLTTNVQVNIEQSIKD